MNQQTIPTPRMDAAYNAGPRGYWTQVNAMLKTGKELERELHAANQELASYRSQIAPHIDRKEEHLCQFSMAMDGTCFICGEKSPDHSHIERVPAHIDGVTPHIEANP
jgi:hypothetical protein